MRGPDDGELRVQLMPDCSAFKLDAFPREAAQSVLPERLIVPWLDWRATSSNGYSAD